MKDNINSGLGCHATYIGLLMWTLCASHPIFCKVFAGLQCWVLHKCVEAGHFQDSSIHSIAYHALLRHAGTCIHYVCTLAAGPARPHLPASRACHLPAACHQRGRACPPAGACQLPAAACQQGRACQLPAAACQRGRACLPAGPATCQQAASVPAPATCLQPASCVAPACGAVPASSQQCVPAVPASCARMRAAPRHLQKVRAVVLAAYASTCCTALPQHSAHKHESEVHKVKFKPSS